jgi:hypothetical protein
MLKSRLKETLKDVEIFGIDPLSALELAAKKNRIDIFKDFLAGYASTVINVPRASSSITLF